MEKFLKNKNLILAIDSMAKRYGKTPIEIMDFSLYEFNLNFVIMIIAEKKMKEVQENLKPDEEKPLSEIGISREIIKIKKENKDGSVETLTTEVKEGDA